MLNNPGIIRNKLKVKASINNSKIFKNITNEYGTFYNYLYSFTKGQTIYEVGRTTNELSDAISNDLQKRGMKFVGSTIIYSYLQAIGIIYSHDNECYLYRG
jgi:DNA-3-methyladenine glycosylase I